MFKNLVEKRILSFVLGAFFLINFDALAADPTSEAVHQLIESYLNKTPAAPLDSNLSLDQAVKVQEQFVKGIEDAFGPPVGYKAGLTSPPAQKRFNLTHPLRGVLMKNMLLKDGAVLPAGFGTRPMSEGDLIMRVGSDDINSAKTPMEALAAMDAVIPFIELPDLVYAKEVKMNGAAISAINVGARYGVLGEPIPLFATSEWDNRLRDMHLEIFDEGGNKLAEGKGSALLGHPLNVVLWLRDSLKREGKRLRKGDLLSLGTITKMIPVRLGATVRARYTGLDPKGPVEVSVRFE